jgi:hypothetical protein
MATKKSIGRTIAHIDVAADTSVRIHKDFFNSHPCFRQLFIPVLHACCIDAYIGAKKYGSPVVERVLQGIVVGGKIERVKNGWQKVCRLACRRSSDKKSGTSTANATRSRRSREKVGFARISSKSAVRTRRWHFSSSKRQLLMSWQAGATPSLTLKFSPSEIATTVLEFVETIVCF